jgi:hypothetical protein
MPGDFFDMQPRPFTALSLAGLSKDAESRVNAALAAMADWRNQVAEANLKNGKVVVEKMAEAATALGWPPQVVDAARTQLKSVAEIQTRTMDQLMDAWEQQIRQPSASPSAILSKLQSLPGGWPGAGDRMPANPFELWMQFAQQWQKVWTDALRSRTH